MVRFKFFGFILLSCLLLIGLPVKTDAQKSSVLLSDSSALVNPVAAQRMLLRVLGKKNADRFVFKYESSLAGNSAYKVEAVRGKVVVTGNSTEALCRGCYDYLKNGCQSIVCWSGSRIHIPEQLPNYRHEVQSPYRYHYYFNIVTHGYTTAYWDWPRWEKEIDWMALHGLNMPLIEGAHEAILYRVFKKMGLTDGEIAHFFTGPAHFPWNQMGNIVGWDGNIPNSYWKKQVALTHRIVNRMKELGMHPIVPAFAGFVPEGIKRLNPDIALRQLKWNGFGQKYQASILPPDSKLFREIGSLYVREWEKEFGKNKFYLADSFNEMEVPLSADSTKALNELSLFGNSVYQSIKEGDPNAVWVMQGWTFPCFKLNGKLFWTPERLNALCSKVPDDKLMILDLANEYNRLEWNIDPSWKMYHGFFGKMWIYSFIPNMGGDVGLNGRLDLYASMPCEALNYAGKKNLTGFGFAPEGIENNEAVYELLSDVGWSASPIDINDWVAGYCRARYGCASARMLSAWKLFLKSCYGSFADHPRYRYQFRPSEDYAETVNSSPEFTKGVKLFLDCSGECSASRLYQNDAIEFAVQYLSLVVDRKLVACEKNPRDTVSFKGAMDLLDQMDRLMASHPLNRLDRWVNYARKWGDNPQEANYYEANAKRLVTTWGGEVNDYSVRTWSGMIKDYYKVRWLKYQSSVDSGYKDRLKVWEEQWIRKPWKSSSIEFKNPVEQIKWLLQKYPE